ncbi:Alpha/beta hydrolase family-domain-containing protein [Xylaria nigripes]|nr:Alpha/beta hydrolase family-domain-containing protein [Xylaria nigripes]
MSSFPFHIKEHVVPCQHIREYARATATSQEDVLNLHVKQYTPKDNPSPQFGDVTILAAHANGFPKELYEALWADLHAQAQIVGGFRIRSIWIADIANEGYSGELNEDKLGNDPFWHDHSRDLLHLTNIFRAEMPRPIIGIGHSFGANILAHLSLLHPRLMTSIVMLDPTILPHDPVKSPPEDVGPSQASAYRREVWPNRQDAAVSFERSPFYGAWDPRVLKAWNKHAIRDLPTPLFPTLPPSETKSNPTAPGVTLRTTKHQEVFMYVRPLYPHITTPAPSTPSTYTYTVSKAGAPDFEYPDGVKLLPGQEPAPLYRSEGATIFRQLPHVRPSTLFIIGGSSPLSYPKLRAYRFANCGIGPGGSGGAKAGRVAEAVIEGKGHLFPMECPTETATHAAPWIKAEIARWRDEQAEFEAWTRQPMREKSTLSQEILDRIVPKTAKSKL